MWTFCLNWWTFSEIIWSFLKNWWFFYFDELFFKVDGLFSNLTNFYQFQWIFYSKCMNFFQNHELVLKFFLVFMIFFVLFFIRDRGNPEEINAIDLAYMGRSTRVGAWAPGSFPCNRSTLRPRAPGALFYALCVKIGGEMHMRKRDWAGPLSGTAGRKRIAKSNNGAMRGFEHETGNLRLRAHSYSATKLCGLYRSAQVKELVLA